MTTVLGTLNVDEAVTLASTLNVTGDTSVSMTLIQLSNFYLQQRGCC